MNGAVIPKTPIAVDCWKTRGNSHVRLFFLSHMHSDHTMGLTSTWNHPIYCSRITGKILHHKLKVNETLIRPLELDVSHKMNLDELGSETMTVTLIDANHCPGSVMFLFEGYFGTILYTGDFRYCPVMLQQPPLNNRMRIDVLYLDNTHCDPDHKLPSRQEATEQIKDIIARHPEHDVVIGLYTIGKETLLVELAQAFQTMIVVSPERLELLNLLELEDVFTADEGAGRIRVVDTSTINYNCMMQWNRVHPTIAILPTGRKVGQWHKDVHNVLYSDHSSYQELLDFVSKLKPCSIEPVIKNQDCEVYFKHCLHSPQKALLKVRVPTSVQMFMRSPVQQERYERRKAKYRAPSRAVSHIHKGVVFESPEKYANSPKDVCTPSLHQKGRLNSCVNGILSPPGDGTKKASSCNQKNEDGLTVQCNTRKRHVNTMNEADCWCAPRDSSTPGIIDGTTVDRFDWEQNLFQWHSTISPANDTNMAMLDSPPLSPQTKCPAETSSDQRAAGKDIVSSLEIEHVDFTKGRMTEEEHWLSGKPVQGIRTDASQAMPYPTASSSMVLVSRTHCGLAEKYPLLPASEVINYSAEQFHRQVENYFRKLKESNLYKF